MSNRIGIIGAGHAGVEAAAAARQGGGLPVLFSNEPVLPYFRPRLPSVAFGQVPLEGIAIHPAAWYAERAIELRLDAGVQALDAAALTVTSARGVERFDALVVATGAAPLLPPLEGLRPGLPVFPLWSAADAARILAEVRPGRHLVVVGGGILGLEAALRGSEAGLAVTLVERLPRLMPLQFGPGASATLQATLERHGMTVRTGCSVRAVSAAPGGAVTLALESGESVPADLVVVSVGARPNPALARAAGLAVDRGVLVDAQLRTSVPFVFAAGDTAQFGASLRCAVRAAVAQGRIAGANAAASRSGAPLQACGCHDFPVTFKSPEVDLAAVGVAAGDGCVEERLDDASRAGVYRAVVRRGGRLVGVQMVGSRERFDELAASLD